MRHLWRWLLRSSDKNFFNSFVFFVFILFQVLDGIFTYFGVRVFGIKVEANFLIESTMSLVGVGWGLVIFKFMAMIAGVFIYYQNRHNSIMVLTAICLVFAILPWVYIFSTL